MDNHAADVVFADGGQGRELHIGHKVQIHWPDDDEWYPGTVNDICGDRCKIHYDDGDVEVLYMPNEKWRFLTEAKKTANNTPPKSDPLIQGNFSFSDANPTIAVAEQEEKEKVGNESVRAVKGAEVEHDFLHESKHKDNHLLNCNGLPDGAGDDFPTDFTLSRPNNTSSSHGDSVLLGNQLEINVKKPAHINGAVDPPPIPPVVFLSDSVSAEDEAKLVPDVAVENATILKLSNFLDRTARPDESSMNVESDAGKQASRKREISGQPLEVKKLKMTAKEPDERKLFSKNKSALCASSEQRKIEENDKVNDDFKKSMAIPSNKTVENEADVKDNTRDSFLSRLNRVLQDAKTKGDLIYTRLDEALSNIENQIRESLSS